jgi:hypothetical protein
MTRCPWKYPCRTDEGVRVGWGHQCRCTQNQGDEVMEGSYARLNMVYTHVCVYIHIHKSVEKKVYKLMQLN